MARRRKVESADLPGPLEAQVMAVLGRHPGVGGMDASRLVDERRAVPLSFRTVLTRLEAKGYVRHVVEGKRTFHYSAVVAEEEFGWHAENAVRDLLKRYGQDVTISGLANVAGADPTLLDRLDELLAR